MRPRDLPNLISVARLLAVAPVVYLLLRREYSWALLVFALAGISDGVDGYLAKRYGWQSRLGGLLDPLADKLLLVCSAVALGYLGLLPLWLVALILVRDLLIVGGALLYHLRIERLDAAPTRVSKLNTVLELLLIVAVIVDAGLVSLPPWLVQGLVWGCVATICVSAVQYVWIWGWRAWRYGRQS